MRAWRWNIALVAGSLMGCTPEMLLYPVLPAVPPEKPAAKVAPKPPAPPPVVAGEITATNARERLQALRVEMDADLQALAEAKEAEAKLAAENKAGGK